MPLVEQENKPEYDFEADLLIVGQHLSESKCNLVSRRQILIVGPKHTSFYAILV